MKKILILSIVSALTFAQGGPGGQRDMGKFKEKATARLDQKISILQEAKSCISAAGSKEEMKACRKSTKEKMKALREQNKKERSANKEKRIQKLREKLKKLESSDS